MNVGSIYHVYINYRTTCTFRNVDVYIFKHLFYFNILILTRECDIAIAIKAEFSPQTRDAKLPHDVTPSVRIERGVPVVLMPRFSTRHVLVVQSSSLLQDGVHFNLTAGSYKYFRSIRGQRAVLVGLKARRAAN